MRVMLAMSGGVDSSVAGALLLEQGHDVVGVTMRLWGGESDSGCCSVADVDDARRVAQQLDIDHLVFNFGDDFDAHVVTPYVDAHAAGVTPNPCIECNRHVKFDRLAERARLLGFDAVATGHHARIGRRPDGRFTLERGADRAKDQSYVVHMLDQAQLAHTLFPVGHLDKAEVRRLAAELGLRTADKPDSQDVCFITSTGGRETFLGSRIPFRRAAVVDTAGERIGEVEAVELVTIGQRRGLGLPGGGEKRYVVEVDLREAAAPTVVVGTDVDLLEPQVLVRSMSWVDDPVGDAIGRSVGAEVLVQVSAHGTPVPAIVEPLDEPSHVRALSEPGSTDATVRITWAEPQRRVAPGQSVVLYDTDDRCVLGGGIAVRA